MTVCSATRIRILVEILRVLMLSKVDLISFHVLLSCVFSEECIVRQGLLELGAYCLDVLVLGLPNRVGDPQVALNKMRTWLKAGNELTVLCCYSLERDRISDFNATVVFATTPSN